MGEKENLKNEIWSTIKYGWLKNNLGMEKYFLNMPQNVEANLENFWQNMWQT